MAPKKICVGIQNFKFACSKICGYLNVVGTCSQILNFVGTQICWYSYSFIDTQVLGHSHLWVLKICGYSEFVMIQNSR